MQDVQFTSAPGRGSVQPVVGRGRGRTGRGRGRNASSSVLTKDNIASKRFAAQTHSSQAKRANFSGYGVCYLDNGSIVENVSDQYYSSLGITCIF